MRLHRPPGFTLVEIMIAMGLGGLLALGMAALLTENARQNARTQRIADLEESLDLFEYALRTHFQRVGRITECQCVEGAGGGAAGCEWRKAATGGDAALPEAPLQGVILRGFLQNSDRLSDPVACADPDRPHQRGCWKEFVLQREAPSPIEAVGADRRVGSPGKLQWLVEGREVATLSGITQLRCGFYPGRNGALSLRAFRIDIEAKQRTQTAQVLSLAESDAGLLQGWHSSDAGFRQGIFRTLEAELPLWNMSYRGVVLGKPRTFANCTPDGVEGAWGQCCSSYQSQTSPGRGLCATSPGCIMTGDPSGLGWGWKGAALSCCTHQDTESGVCARRSALELDPTDDP